MQPTLAELLNDARQRLHAALDRQTLAAQTCDLEQVEILSITIMQAAQDIHRLSRELETQDAK